jgi:hypothetical protein
MLKLIRDVLNVPGCTLVGLIEVCHCCQLVHVLVLIGVDVSVLQNLVRRILLSASRGIRCKAIKPLVVDLNSANTEARNFRRQNPRKT